MQRHHFTTTLLALAAIGCTQPLSGPAQRDETSGAAQASLDDFLAKAKQQPPGTSGYALRVRLQEGRDSEYFWVDEFTWSDGAFTGRINDEPRLLKRIKPGQFVKFNRSQVVDWKYTDDKTGNTIGPYTARKEPTPWR